MGIFTLLSALVATISDTIRESVERNRAIEEQRRYEDIDWGNIEYVTLDGTETAYRIEEEEEFDIVMSDFLTQQDGWQHYETKTVQHEVEDGGNYCFTIRYKDGKEIHRKFHEDSDLSERLLTYVKEEDDDTVGSHNDCLLGSVFDTIDELDAVITKLEKTVDAELIKAGYDPNDFDMADSFGELEEEDYPEFQPIRDERFAVIDFETTGLNYDSRRPPMDEIISVAIINQDENVLLDTYCSTVKKTTWYEAEQIHGISPRDVKGYPTFVEIMPKVIEILSSYDYVISYNVPFERFFLENYAHLYTPTDFSVHKINWGEDPMRMFMDYMSSKRFLKLETAAEHFGYRYNAHNALEDTKAALYVYKAMRGK